MKVSGIVASGAEARDLIRHGFVVVNGEKESRLRRKIRKGDKVATNQILLDIVSPVV